MNWKTEEPKDGDIRITTYFPLLPKDILGTTYWLEFVKVREQWHTPKCEGYYSQWVPIGVL